jgi:hypothetical protein
MVLSNFGVTTFKLMNGQDVSRQQSLRDPCQSLQSEHKIARAKYYCPDGFGGLVLASGSRVSGFDPDRCEKILSMPSFGGEVK